MSGKQKKKKKKTGLQKAIKVISIILIVVIVAFAGVVAGGWTYISGLLSNMKQESIDVASIKVSTSKDLEKYRNIALLGIDSRADDYSLGNRSDCIIIASINKDTNDVKLISVYRDTYLQLEEEGDTVLDKVTHAYSYGGAQNTLLALNTNLDLNIKEYITVNFDAVIAAVDALGGIQINIESEEIEHINVCIDEQITVTGKSSSHITSSGKQTLDGIQALGYARVRNTAGGDYKRTERMRDVIEAMVTKAKSLSISELIDFANALFPKISTNISQFDIVTLAPKLASVSFSDSLGWPYKTEGITLDRWYGVPITLESNVKKLHEEVFGAKDYVLPDEVKNISDKIINKTGYSGE